ncbi:glycine oxidase [Thermocatellispora tengchongensis]|uniref:Glycine oxidase n=1 Tax=Thermocatellispora tengchongensis TaxID=1073253 RepID=A0A840P5W3_9ACTN|nr:FAD-dependent oxidoreductase [Thermocatellispora tengchongensis]MBB5134389.1 glycine oxidase [Thermocatellispora tengchongensis]
MQRYDFVLVGGGIVGACLAEELAGTGASVAVLDAGDEAGHASVRAAGVAVPSLRYVTDLEFYRWLQRARLRLDTDIERLEPRYGAFSLTRPILRMLRLAEVHQYAAALEAAGVTGWLDPGALAGDLARGLADGLAQGLTAGLRLSYERRRFLYDENGLMVDGARYLAAVRRRCLDLGVAWRQRTTVLEVGDGAALVTSAGTVRADRTVITAGAWSGTAGLAGKGVPVYPQRGQLVTIASEETLPLIFSSICYLAPGVDGEIIAGATEEDAGFDDRCDVSGITRLLRFAAATMPSLLSATPTALRSGLRPVSATGRPLIGRVPGEAGRGGRLWVASGHAGHGLISARLTAESVAAALTTGTWFDLPASMCPSRAAEARACASTT